MKRVEIDTNTKGIVLFAKGKDGYSDWLVLVTRVEYIGVLKIYGHIFYNISEKAWYFSGGDENYAWGNIDHWDFFEPTKEQKQKIVDALREKGYKYVPVLNKIIYKKINV